MLMNVFVHIYSVREPAADGASVLDNGRMRCWFVSRALTNNTFVTEQTRSIKRQQRNYDASRLYEMDSSQGDHFIAFFFLYDGC